MFKITPSARWVRVKINGITIADSKKTLLVWDDYNVPRYFFPREDIRMDLLQSTERGRGARTGYHIQAGDKRVENAAWSYTNPDPKRAKLKDYMVLRWKKMDHWYEEAEEVFLHARDIYTRVDTIPSTRHIRVVLDGVTLADTRRPMILFETHAPTRYYIPVEDVNMDYLQPTDTHTICPYKGTASYYSIEIGGKIYKDYVWVYRDPIPEIPKIKGLLAFYNEKVAVYVDGELEVL